MPALAAQRRVTRDPRLACSTAASKQPGAEGLHHRSPGDGLGNHKIVVVTRRDLDIEGVARRPAATSALTNWRSASTTLSAERRLDGERGVAEAWPRAASTSWAPAASSHAPNPIFRVRPGRCRRGSGDASAGRRAFAGDACRSARGAADQCVAGREHCITTVVLGALRCRNGSIPRCRLPADRGLPPPRSPSARRSHCGCSTGAG